MKKLPQETSELPNPRSFYLNPLPPQGFAHKEPKETLLKRAIGGEGEPAKSTQRTNQIPIPTRFAILTSGRFPRRSESRTPNLTLPQTCKERTRGNRHHQTARKIATKPNLPKILQEAAELLTISSAPPRSAPVQSRGGVEHGHAWGGGERRRGGGDVVWRHPQGGAGGASSLGFGASGPAAARHAGAWTSGGRI